MRSVGSTTRTGRPSGARSAWVPGSSPSPRPACRAATSRRSPGAAGSRWADAPARPSPPGAPAAAGRVPVADVDAGVLQAAQLGAGWAFERIYRQLGPVVHGYLRAQGADDPEGSVNDVFLRAFRGVAAFTGDPPAFRSWLFTIAHHLV